MTKSYLIIAFSLFLQLSVHCQINFDRGNQPFRTDKIQFSGMATGVADLNGDLYDDLIVLNKSKFLEVGYNQGKTQAMDWKNPVKVYETEEYSIIIGDFKNDGVSEIISGGIYSGTKVYKQNTAGEYQKVQDIQPLIYTQASNAIDFDNDGFLDYFACHDEGTNLMLRNDGTGNLTPVNMIDFTTTPPSDNSGNYGSEWSDVDNDGDMDLYIAKCRFGVTDREDPRRHNMLFINNGNGKFVNEAVERGLKIKGQSWTGSFADIDNDGDMDCIVTNHDEPHILLINDGKGFFTPKDIGLPQTFAFQSLWADFDNDTRLDLLLTGADVDILYRNIGNNNFERMDDVFGSSIINSASLGDINDDGFVDVNTVYGVNIIYPGSNRDEVFINKGNANHYIKVSLLGKQSNKMGIGARLSLYGPWGIQSREVTSGVSYGISNSLNQIFGLAEYTAADSLVIRWPSGSKQTFSAITADAHYIIEENGCMTKRIDLISPKDELCPNESISLSLNKTYESYIWSNGSNQPTLNVNKRGAYSVIVKDFDGCTYYSSLKYISQLTPNDYLIIPHVDSLFFCENATLSLNYPLSNVSWSTGQSGNIYQTNATNEIVVSGSDHCGQTWRDTIFTKKIDYDIEVINDTVSQGGNAILKVVGNNVSWYSDEDKKNLIHTGNSINLFNVQNTTTYFVQSNVIDGINQYTIGEKNIPSTGNVYSADNNDVGLYFNAYKNLTIQSFEVASDKAGVRSFLLINYEGDTIGRKNVFIEASDRQLVEVDFAVSPGSLYQLKTDASVNLKNFGHEAPRLKRLASSTSYPYEIYGVAEIPVSLRGGEGYYYFFNIQVIDDGVQCQSDLKPISAVLTTSTDDSDQQSLLANVFPNPNTGLFNIQIHEHCIVRIYDETGRQIYMESLDAGKHDIEIINTNSHILSVSTTNGQKNQWHKIVVIR